MPKRKALLTLLAIILSGCNSQALEHHKETMRALDETELKLKQDIQELTLLINKKDAVVQTLSDDVRLLTQQMKVLMEEAQAAKEPTKNADTKPQVVYVEKEIPATRFEGKVVLGEKEWVWLDVANQNFHARVDTGATTSSLNAKNIEEFERDGETWVRFDLVYTDKDDAKNTKETKLEAPLVRWVRIRQSSTDKLDRRPVISLRIRIGDLNEKAQFTLADRSHMEFPILLGREFFKDIVVVDVSQNYIHAKHELSKP